MADSKDDDVATQVLGFMAVAERLKKELRHSWLSDGRRESVAEHSWLMALMAVLIHRHLAEPVRLDRVLAMIVVHDLAEAEVGDIPYFETSARKDAKAAAERAAMDGFVAKLPAPEGELVRELWLEFEEGRTPEARLARALDHLEVQVQHNLADFATWEPIEHDLVYTKMDDRCAHDPLLKAMCAGIRAQAEAKMRAGGVDVDTVRARLGLAESGDQDVSAPR
jgi:putative hydrolase of HD superfamily